MYMVLKVSMVNKAFGNLVYDMSMSEYISIIDFNNSIVKIEVGYV